MYRLLPPVDSVIEREGGGGGRRRTQEGGRRVKSSERWEVEGKQRRGRSEKFGGGGLSIWFPLCICMFVFVGEEGRAGKEGRKGRGASAGL